MNAKNRLKSSCIIYYIFMNISMFIKKKRRRYVAYSSDIVHCFVQRPNYAEMVITRSKCGLQLNIALICESDFFLITLHSLNYVTSRHSIILRK